MMGMVAPTAHHKGRTISASSPSTVIEPQKILRSILWIVSLSGYSRSRLVSQRENFGSISKVSCAPFSARNTAPADASPLRGIHSCGNLASADFSRDGGLSQGYAAVPRHRQFSGLGCGTTQREMGNHAARIVVVPIHFAGDFEIVDPPQFVQREVGQIAGRSVIVVAALQTHAVSSKVDPPVGERVSGSVGGGRGYAEIGVCPLIAGGGHRGGNFGGGSDKLRHHVHLGDVIGARSVARVEIAHEMHRDDGGAIVLIIIGSDVETIFHDDLLAVLKQFCGVLSL